jgi:hypothetical protein
MIVGILREEIFILAELWLGLRSLNNRGAGAQKRESETGSRNKSGA